MSSAWWRTDAITWQAHGWQLELRGDELADIRYHGRILLRAVRAVVRDRGWRTVPVAVRHRAVNADSLLLGLRHDGLGATLTSTLSMHARAGELVIRWDAASETDVETCRAGLVALHSWTAAGHSVTVVHPDGTEEPTVFPDRISPHQPMRDIRELRLDDGTSIAFAGDVFEMEDQRNWTDASYKTYSRPLDLPYPYSLAAGEPVTQTITLTTTAGARQARLAEVAAEIELHRGGRFPEIGVEASTAPDPVPAEAVGTFRVVELDLTTPTWRSALHRATHDGLALDVRLVSDGAPGPVYAAALALATVPVPVLRVAAFDSAAHVTTPALADVVRRALGAAGIAAPFASGARSHFTELNREQAMIARDVDAIVLTTTPLFHTLDTEQLTESVRMQRLVAEEAVRIADGLEVHIGPVSLRPRFNNVATTPQAAPTRADLAEGYGAEFTGAPDGRQRAPELASWVIASAAALAVPGVGSLSWFETWGSRGLADGSGRRPAADAVAALADLCGSELLTGQSPDGLIWAIGGQRDGVARALAANLDRRSRDLTVHLPSGIARVTLPPAGWVSIER